MIQINQNKTYYQNYNHEGSLISLRDINGNTIKEITYSLYGKILKNANNAKEPKRYHYGLKNINYIGDWSWK